MSNIKLYNGDCLEIMKDISDNSIDLILCDLPYGVLNKSNNSAKWDSLIPLEKLWAEYKRIITDNGAIILFGQGMFTAKLMLSNEKMWRYNLIWKKGNRASGFLNAHRQPMRNHEDIVVFSKKQTVYNPIMREGQKSHSRGNNYSSVQNCCYGEFKQIETEQTDKKFPLSVLDFEREHPQKYHPTQKPVALLEYLIKTYSFIGDTVLDNCMGSGSTGVACKNTDRDFIGIELEKKYFDIANDRINKVGLSKEQIIAEIEGQLSLI